MTTEPSFTLVASAADLAPLLHDLESAHTVVLDTEADSLHHYHEKICLIQLSIDGRHWIVDPLAGFELARLLNLLEGHELLIHGSDYDLRLLFRSYGMRPTRVFDTMLAAQLLGREQFGLAALVEPACGVVLNKHGQRADWSRRPLPENLLAYAVDDTRYLHIVADALKKELIEKGRLDWHREWCERALSAALTPRPEPQEDGWRIKGARHLTGRPAAVLRELWLWRDEIAERLDRPPFKVAGAELLLQYAMWAEENPEGTEQDAPEPPHWLRGDRLSSFSAALRHALAMPKENWPGRPARTQGLRSTREDEEALTKIIHARDALAHTLEIQPGVLAPREGLRLWVTRGGGTMEDFAANSTLMNWQTNLLAEAAWEAVREKG